MAVGLASAIANSILNAYGRNVAWTQPAAFWVKLHIGDPGSAGTANAAANTTRQQATFSAASGGAMTNSAQVAWTNVPNAETYSHVSFWDASSGGTFLGSDALDTSRLMAVGDNFTISASSLNISITPIAA